jgi:hypothetical protein
VHAITHSAALFGYSTGGAVLTLVLPLGLFIVVMIGLYVAFARRRTVPGQRPVDGPKPVAPDPRTARDMAAASGFPTATSAGGVEPLADRATPPRVGARSEDDPADGDTAVTDTAAHDTVAHDTVAQDSVAHDTVAEDNVAVDNVAGDGDTAAEETE